MDVYQQFIHKSRYARWLPEFNRRESWEETVDRYITFVKEQSDLLGAKKIDFDELRSAIVNMEIMPSMRALMTAGPAAKRCNMAFYNCSALAIDSLRSFDEVMYVLMNGTGVGFSVEEKFVSKLPEIPETFHITDTVIVVGDSKKGWASSFRELIALLYAGKIPSWDVSKVRPAGEPLKVFGGRASGPDPLVGLFEYTVKLITKAAGRKLTSLECHDLVCKTAAIVVAGGVRRSATISLSDIHDDSMRDAKSGTWYVIEPQRALANNSAVYNSKPSLHVFMEEWDALIKSGSGERGIFNRASLVKTIPSRRTPHDTYLTNPCFAGDQRFLTTEGWRRFDEMEGLSVDIIQDKAFSANIVDGVEQWFPTGEQGLRIINSPLVAVTGYNKEIYKLTTVNGRVIKATANHKFATQRGFVELSELITHFNNNGSYPDELIIPHVETIHDETEINNDDYESGIEWAKHNLKNVSLLHYQSSSFKKGALNVFTLSEEELSVDVLNDWALIENEFGISYDDENFDTVFDIELDHIADKVYCLKEDTHRTAIVQGVTVARCGEIALRPQGLCNLSEVIVRSTDTIESLHNKVRLATVLGTLQSSFTDFDYVRSIWKKNAEEERLLGVSLTGIVSREWTAEELQSLKQIAIDTNKDVAEDLGINQSVAITCGKPSGTVSQLVDCASGIHPVYANHYIRRVRNSVSDPISQVMINAGVPYEFDVHNQDTYVFSFPKKGYGLTRHDVNALDQLETYKLFKENWAEHNMSITVYVAEHEWLDVAAWVYKNFDMICGVSFLPKNDDEHVYEQAPYEEITEAQYNELIKGVPTSVDWVSVIERQDDTTGAQELACVAGSCEIP